MLVISDSIKNAYSKYTTQRKSYIRVGNSSFFVQNLDVSADAYLDGNVIGNAIAKIVKFDIETVNVSGIDEFELFDGIWTGNQYEYISLGTFKLFNEEGTDDFFSSITAYDKLVLFNKEYDPTQTTYPTTLYGLLKNICNQAGVELENTSITNGNQTITSNLFVENETLKNVLNAISQISGNYAIISKDKLKLLLKGTETINLNKSQISNPEYKRTTWKINQVVLGMSDIEGEYVLRQDVTDIEKNGVHKLVINDNPFVYTQALREVYIDNLFNQVKGFGYTAFETQWEGLSYVELGDLLNIDGKESIVLRYNLKSPDGLKSTLSAPSIIDSVIEYVDNSNSIKNRQNRTEIAVDKQNQKINAVVSDVNKNKEKVASLEITTGNISTKVSSVETDLNTTKTNLSNLSNTVDTLSDDIDGVSADFEDFKDNEYIQSIDNLQKQIDGAIQFWNGAKIPTLGNYPANEWTTENDKINHQADIYTVVEDIDGEMKQGKSYRFDKIDGVWQWIELTDNELSAVQAIAQEALNKANTNANEIGGLKSSVSTLKQTDDSIKASVETINNQIIPTSQISGSNIHIEDSSDAPLINLEIEGKSEQKTRSGKNLLNLTGLSGSSNGVTYSATKTGKLLLNGTCTSDRVTIPLPELALNGTYTFSTNYLKTTALKNASASNLFITSGSNGVVTSTVEDTVTQLIIYITSGTVFEEQEIELQLKEGTIATEWEQYGASPSPDYPSEIDSVGYENLFDGLLELGSFNSSGEKVTNTNCVRTVNFIEIEPNTKYFLFSDLGYTTMIQYYDESKTFVKTSTILNSIFTTPENAKYIKWRSSAGNVENNLDVKFQLEKGSIAHSYIPYGKSAIEVKTVKKNLLNHLIMTGLTSQGITTQINEDGSFSVSGTATSSYANLIDLISCNYGSDTYTFSIDKLLGFNLILRFYDSNKTTLSSHYVGYSADSVTITLTGEEKYYRLLMPAIAENVYNYTFFPQLEKGDIVTPFEKYQENILTVVLDEPLRKVGNANDVAYIKNNKLYVDRKVGSIVLNGSESWAYDTSHFYFRCPGYDFSGKIPLGSSDSTVCSSHFEYISGWSNFRDSHDKNGINNISNTGYKICIRNLNCITVAEFKEWLSANNVEIQYELAEPYTEEIVEIEMPSTFKGVTNITTTDELNPNINIEYVRDTTLSSYVEGQLQNERIIREENIAQLIIENNQIKESVSSVSADLSSANTTINKVEETLNSQEKIIEIISTNIDQTTGTVKEVTTTNGFTFNNKGLNIYTDENSYNTQINNVGTYYKDGDEIVSQTTKDGSLLKNLSQQGQSKYSYDDTNKIYDFVEERIEVDGESAYATFYNGEE